MNIKYFKQVLILLFALFLNSTHSVSLETKIILKLDDNLITNVDIENEYRYLLAISPNFNNLEKKILLNIAKESLIKELIKEQELNKFIDLDKQEDTSINEAIRNMYQKIGLKNTDEFKTYLKKKEISYEDIYKKIKIEVFWNQLIYQNYINKVKINREMIKNKILKNRKKQNIFNLSEIVYTVENKKDLEIKYNEIIKSINDKGFEETVLLFSISQSKTSSGLIGWVSENSLSSKILNQIKKLKNGEVSKPIIVTTGILVLKLNDKKESKEKINIELEIEEIVKKKLNEQLNNYSSIYFNKIKSNYIINEY